MVSILDVQAWDLLTDFIGTQMSLKLSNEKNHNRLSVFNSAVQDNHCGQKSFIDRQAWEVWMQQLKTTAGTIVTVSWENGYALVGLHTFLTCKFIVYFPTLY